MRQTPAFWEKLWRLMSRELTHSAQEQDRQCPQNETMSRVPATIVAVEKTISVTYSECVSVALGSQHVTHTRHIAIRALPRSTTFFPHYLTNGTIFEKKVTEHKMCVLIFCTTFV